MAEHRKRAATSLLREKSTALLPRFRVRDVPLLEQLADPLLQSGDIDSERLPSPNMNTPASQLPSAGRGPLQSGSRCLRDRVGGPWGERGGPVYIHYHRARTRRHFLRAYAARRPLWFSVFTTFLRGYCLTQVSFAAAIYH